MTSKESTQSSSKVDSRTYQLNSPNPGLFKAKTSTENKYLAGTASPFRKELCKGVYEIRPTLHSFESLMEDDEVRIPTQSTFSKAKTEKTSYNPLKSPVQENKTEPLSKKMPNFIMNYEDLMELVTTNVKIDQDQDESKTKNEPKSPKSNIFNFNQVSKTPEKKAPEEKKLEGISSLITAANQKKEKEEEERCVMMKSLTNTEEIKDFYENTEECLKRIAKLKVVPEKEIEHLKVRLPFDKEFNIEKKKLAVFDLDETLVHCEIKKPSKGEVQINVKIPSGAITKVGLNIRPFWRESLMEIKKHYVIIVYTASHQSYADSVLDYLDPEKELIQYRLYRHNCVRVKMENDFIYVKDMRIFENVELKNMTIIDNSALSFAFQLENGIPILPFYNNKDDNELTFLTHYLTYISKSDDLREENRKSLKLDYFLQAAVDESSLMESYIEEDGDYSIDKDREKEREQKNQIQTDKTNKKISSTGLINLNSCDTNEVDLSLESSFNISNYSIIKEESSKMKYSSRSNYNTNENKKATVLQGQLLVTLSELKRTLESNLKNNKK
jgi:Dullard-like phosphatase family protein